MCASACVRCSTLGPMHSPARSATRCRARCMQSCFYGSGSSSACVKALRIAQMYTRKASTATHIRFSQCMHRSLLYMIVPRNRAVFIEAAYNNGIYDRRPHRITCDIRTQQITWNPSSQRKTLIAAVFRDKRTWTDVIRSYIQLPPAALHARIFTSHWWVQYTNKCITVHFVRAN